MPELFRHLRSINCSFLVLLNKNVRFIRNKKITFFDEGWRWRPFVSGVLRQIVVFYVVAH